MTWNRKKFITKDTGLSKNGRDKVWSSLPETLNQKLENCEEGTFSVFSFFSVPSIVFSSSSLLEVIFWQFTQACSWDLALLACELGEMAAIAATFTGHPDN